MHTYSYILKFYMYEVYITGKKCMQVENGHEVEESMFFYHTELGL